MGGTTFYNLYMFNLVFFKFTNSFFKKHSNRMAILPLRPASTTSSRRMSYHTLVPYLLRHITPLSTPYPQHLFLHSLHSQAPIAPHDRPTAPTTRRLLTSLYHHRPRFATSTRYLSFGIIPAALRSLLSLVLDGVSSHFVRSSRNIVYVVTASTSSSRYLHSDPNVPDQVIDASSPPSLLSLPLRQRPAQRSLSQCLDSPRNRR